MKTLVFIVIIALIPWSINAQDSSDICARDQNPQFQGGHKALERYIAKNFIYPEEAVRDDIKGRVVVEFIVNKKGKISREKVVESAHPLLDKETIRMIQTMPEWDPACQNGKRRRTRVTLPVVYCLYK